MAKRLTVRWVEGAWVPRLEGAESYAESLRKAIRKEVGERPSGLGEALPKKTPGRKR
jgi:hypothetical protein